MTLQELFDDLTFGEFSQLNLGGAETMGVTPDNHRRVVSHVNRGLTALHRRFALKTERLPIALAEGEQYYPLVGGVLPFLRLDRVLWPEGFTSEVIPPRGENPVLPLNDESSPISVYTPNHRTLQVPATIWKYGVRELTVVYRGNHDPIGKETGAFAPDEVEVDLPEAFREALLYFIAGNVTTPLGASPEGYHEGNSYLSRYENACQQLELDGWSATSLPERTAFRDRGFV